MSFGSIAIDNSYYYVIYETMLSRLPDGIETKRVLIVVDHGIFVVRHNKEESNFKKLSSGL